MSVPVSARCAEGGAACPACGAFAMDFADMALLCGACGWCTWPLQVRGNNLDCASCGGECCAWPIVAREDCPAFGEDHRAFHIDVAHHVCPDCPADSPSNTVGNASCAKGES